MTENKMSSSPFGLFLTMVVMTSFVYGNPTGTPDAACDAMVPNHGSTPQSGTSSYTISLSSMSYRCGGNITVTLGGTSAFKGFFCQARKMVDEGSSRVGTFDVTGRNDVQLRCNSAAVTHTSRSEKTSMEFTWKPVENYGNVSIVCSWVQQTVTYWVREPSETLMYEAGGECVSGASHVTSGLLLAILSFISSVVFF